MATSESFLGKVGEFFKRTWYWFALGVLMLFAVKRREPAAQKMPRQDNPSEKIVKEAREEIETVLKTEPQYDKVVEEATIKAEVNHVENKSSSDPYGNV